MKLRIHDDIGDFRNVVVDIFCRDPIMATVELTVLRSISADADPAPLLVTVWLGAKLVGAAIQTPPYPLLCGGLPRVYIDDVVAGLVDLGIDLSGVRGPRDTA
ncbi:MAG: N-acetyltransferase, partial [Mycolicibacterium sp.]|nr:N-acetyltransferase [Mycolicibacterium sp.]